MSDETNDVGYGKPPKEHQFKKGQSGNPSGRPKSTGSIELDVDVVLCGKVRMQTPDGTKPIETREAVLRTQVKKGFKGDLRAIRYLFEQFEKYEAIKRPTSKIQTGVVVVPTPWSRKRG